MTDRQPSSVAAGTSARSRRLYVVYLSAYLGATVAASIAMALAV